VLLLLLLLLYRTEVGVIRVLPAVNALKAINATTLL